MPDKFETSQMLRGLKGSSGGGGGGGSSGSGGRGFVFGGGGGGGTRLSTGAWIGFIFASIAIMVLIQLWKKAAREEADVKGSAALFNDRQDKARNKFMTHTGDSKIAHLPQSGTYNYMYIENDTNKSGTATFTFTELGDRRGYKISGKIVDMDGSSVIKEGNVCYNGKNAYWKDERVKKRGKMLAVINDGEFNFEENTFQGRWMSVHGIEGTFYKFALSDKNAQQPVSEQSIQQAYDLQGKTEDLVEAQPAPTAPPIGASPSINNTSDNVPSSAGAEKTSLFDSLYTDMKK